MKNSLKKLTVLLIVSLLLCSVACFTVFAAEAEPTTAVATVAEDATEQEKTVDPTVGKAVAAAACVGLVAATGAISMGLVISKTAENTARQPEAAEKIGSNMMLGLVFIETVIIYALIVAILIIFVL